MHTDTECGTCHQGDVWRDQFGGHVLRRLIGSRWKKNDNNAFCIDCHGDTELMTKVKLEDLDTKEKHPVDYRWIHASESYERSLHSRLLVTGVEGGASCMDCHAPTTMGEFRHDIRWDEDELSSTHPDNLAKTCAQSSCHEFAVNTMNAGFVNTDLHDVDQVKIRDWKTLVDSERLQSNWQKGFYLLGAIALVFIGGSIFWLFKGINEKKQNPLVGDESFEKIIIGRKGKKSAKKGGTRKKPAAATKRSASVDKLDTDKPARKPRAKVAVDSKAQASTPAPDKQASDTGASAPKPKANEDKAPVVENQAMPEAQTSKVEPTPETSVKQQKALQKSPEQISEKNEKPEQSGEDDVEK